MFQLQSKQLKRVGIRMTWSISILSQYIATFHCRGAVNKSVRARITLHFYRLYLKFYEAFMGNGWMGIGSFTNILSYLSVLTLEFVLLLFISSTGVNLW